MTGFHHVRARMRREPFPATTAWKRFLDYLMYAVAIVAPLALVPQIIQVYTTKSAVGVSLLTWFLLASFNALWMLYGAVHKDKQLFFANALMVLFDLILIVGVLVY